MLPPQLAKQMSQVRQHMVKREKCQFIACKRANPLRPKLKPATHNKKKHPKLQTVALQSTEPKPLFSTIAGHSGRLESGCALIQATSPSQFVSRSMLNMYLHKSHKRKEVNVVRKMHYASAVSALPNLPLLALLASVLLSACIGRLFRQRSIQRTCAKDGTKNSNKK